MLRPLTDDALLLDCQVIGSAIALELLIGMPLVWGVLLTALDVLLLLGVFGGPNKVRKTVVTERTVGLGPSQYSAPVTWQSLA